MSLAPPRMGGSREAGKVHRQWFEERFGSPQPNHHLFPWGRPTLSNPNRHATDITWAWDQLRKTTGVVPESTILALMGHMSRSILSVTATSG